MGKGKNVRLEPIPLLMPGTDTMDMAVDIMVDIMVDITDILMATDTGAKFKINANLDLEKKIHCHQHFKLQNQKLPTEVIVFKIQNSESQIFFCILIFFCFYVQRATTVLCFKKNFRYFFLLVFFKKTFSGIFFYLNSTKCNCGL